MKPRFPILWLTGNSGAGKTTLAQGLQSVFETKKNHPLSGRVVVLDGDEMRQSISVEETMSAEDRRRHNLRVARLATVLRAQGFLVVVAVIAPFDAVRSEVHAICEPRWIYLKRTGLDAADRPYEPPKNPDFTVDIDVSTAEETREATLVFVEELVGLTVS